MLYVSGKVNGRIDSFHDERIDSFHDGVRVGVYLGMGNGNWVHKEIECPCACL